MTSNENDSSGIVCPESGLDSVRERNEVRPRAPSKAAEARKTVACESTLDSSLRRNFIKKAALATAAIGIGGSVLGNGLNRVSSAKAKPDCCVYTCDITVKYCAVLYDYGHCNTGNLRPGISFETYECSTIVASGIASAHAPGSPNRFGLDFYAGGSYCTPIKRMSLTAAGELGIGTCNPSSTLCVVGSVAAASDVFVNTARCNNGSSLYPGIVFGGSGSGEGIAGARACGSPNQYGLDFYTGRTKRMSITNGGNVGIGYQPCHPTSTLCVIGSPCTASNVISGQALVPGAVGVYGSGSTGVIGSSCSGAGVKGLGYPGVCAQSSFSYGVQAQACQPIIGRFKNRTTGASCDKTALVQFENADSTPVDWNAGVAGAGNACKIPDGSFYVGQPSKPRVVLNTTGNLGLGTLTPATTLHVNGSLSAKISTVKTSYTMTASDFAVLANASSGGITVTLPAAKTAAGMMVHIKKVDSSANIVTVKPAGSDKIEGLASESLSKIYKSLMLISDGTSSWYILSSAK